MQRHSRTQYMFGNTLFRTQRNRVKPTGDQTIGATNWANISNLAGEAGSTGWVRVTGITNETSFLISVPAVLDFAANGGYISYVVSPNADFSNASYFDSVKVDDATTTTGIFRIKPGEYVLFESYCDIPYGPFTVTVSNQMPNRSSVDTFTIAFT